MIRVFNEIKRVGRFADFSSSGQQDLKELTLVYGENGSGKTTLARIFRSLRAGDTNILKALQTFGKSDPSYIKINTSSGDVILDSWNWNKSISEIEIYDSHFVNNNVFAGDVIEKRHKTNMYRLVIGKKGVKLSQKEEKLKDKRKSIKKEAETIKDKIKQNVQSNVSFDKFLEIEEEENIDSKIESKKKEIDRIEKESRIKKEDKLSKIDLPDLPKYRLIDILGKSLEDVSESAEEKVRRQVELELGEGSEEWIERGYKYMKESENCPYCGQGIKGVDLIQAYRDYFSNEYEEFKKGIEEFKKEILSIVGGEVVSNIQDKITNNRELSAFWKDIIDISLEHPETTKVRQKVKSAREEVISDIDKKLSSPLDEVKVSDKAEEGVKILNKIKEQIKNYNIRVKKLNEKIEKVKEEVGEVDKAEEMERLNFLMDKKTRWSEDVEKMCKNYINKKEELESVKEKRKEAKKESNEYTEKIFEEYEDDINKYLNKFGASFNIANIRPSRRGKRVSSKYDIEVGEGNIGIEGKGMDEGVPEFQTALSTGDKNTLAFALFCAKMNNTNIEDKIVVIDDPVTSLDIHREENAATEILSIADEAMQTLVFSHNPHFLNIVYNHAQNGYTNRLLKVRITGSTSKIENWDKEKDLKNGFRRDVEKISSFVNDGKGEKMSVLRSIRPMLETYIQVLYPSSVPSNDTLGTYINKIESSDPSEPLSGMKNYLDDLKEIKNFTDKYMHGGAVSRPNPPQHHLVESHANRSLEIVST